jgi:hypothetical protein
MTLDEYLEVVAHSGPNDWNTITAWGANSGPSYRDQFSPGEYDGQYQLQHHEHSMRAAYKPNLGITIAWGLDRTSHRPNEFSEPWHQDFPDSGASAHFVDFFYNGDLVHREVYVDVDGGRANLPLPHRDFDSETGDRPTVTAYWITRWQYEFFKTLDQLERSSDFDSYLQRAGFEVRD